MPAGVGARGRVVLRLRAAVGCVFSHSFLYRYSPLHNFYVSYLRAATRYHLLLG